MLHPVRPRPPLRLSLAPGRQPHPPAPASHWRSMRGPASTPRPRRRRSADRGIQDLGGWATGLTSTGRLTGLVASVLLLVQVVLMSRLPFLEAAFGQDRLAHLHRLVGFTSFNLMLAHIVTITWGYAAGELARTPSTLWDLTMHYPGMLLAVAGTACLCLVVVACVNAARRRIRYESWHLLHLYAYAGVGL